MTGNTIGMMRHRITFKEAVETADGGGGVSLVWQDIAATPTVSAALQTLSGNELFRFRKLAPRTTHRFVIRHREDLNTKMRIEHDSETYEILTILDRHHTKKQTEILAFKE